MQVPFSAMVLARRRAPLDAAWLDELAELARLDQPFRPRRAADDAFDMVLRADDGRLHLLYCTHVSTAVAVGDMEMLYPWAEEPDAWACAYADAFSDDPPSGEVAWDAFARRARAFCEITQTDEVLVGRHDDVVEMYRGGEAPVAVRLRGGEICDAQRWRDVADMLAQAARE